MKSIVKKVGRTLLGAFGLEALGRLYFQKSALKEVGWFRSVTLKQSVDASGMAKPWFTYSFLFFFEERLRSDMKIFEYGAGQSTFFYGNLLDTVHAVEHDPLWFDLIVNDSKNQTNKSIHIMLEEIPERLVGNDLTDSSYMEQDGNYVNSIDKAGIKYDIVVIDGLFRNSCAINCIDFLSDSGVIVFDNTHRKSEIQKSTDVLKANGFKRIDFWGMCAIYSQMSCTTVFYREANCFGI